MRGQIWKGIKCSQIFQLHYISNHTISLFYPCRLHPDGQILCASEMLITQMIYST